jgi:MFS family permease
MGPVLGPVVGGYLGEAVSWRYIMVLITCLTGAMLIAQAIYVPETYAPVLLRHRARELEKHSGKVHISKLDHMQGPKSVWETLKVAMSRPWVLLFKEPIVLILSIYMAIIYGTLYMMFAAFPIVFQQGRGWSQGQSGLAFFGTAVGMAFALVYMFWENRRFNRVAAAFPQGRAPPEARLIPTMAAAVFLPIGLFWFAWTNGPEMHWIVCIIGSSFFGVGNIMLNLGCVNYLVDSYVIYTASVMAANAMLRSVLGATFPLFTGLMYKKLGLHWASSIPAFLALLCMPFPFVFYKYGPQIRARCKYAVEAQKALDEILESSGDVEHITELDVIEEESRIGLEKSTTKDL